MIVTALACRAIEGAGKAGEAWACRCIRFQRRVRGTAPQTRPQAPCSRMTGAPLLLDRPTKVSLTPIQENRCPAACDRGKPCDKGACRDGLVCRDMGLCPGRSACGRHHKTLQAGLALWNDFLHASSQNLYTDIPKSASSCK